MKREALEYIFILDLMALPKNTSADMILKLLVLCCLSISYLVSSQKVIRIGAVLSSAERVDEFTQAVANLTAPEGYIYKSAALVAGRNPIVTATDICDHLITQQVLFRFSYLYTLQQET